MTVPLPLIDAFLDDHLDDDQTVALQTWLAADREHLRAFLRITSVHRALRREFTSAQAHVRFSAQAPSATTRRLRIAARRGGSRRPVGMNPWWLRGAGIAAGLLLAIGLVMGGHRAGDDAVQIAAGSAVIERPTGPVPAHAGDVVQRADAIVAAQGPVTLRFADGTTVRLDADARIVLTSAGSADQGKRLELGMGRLSASVAKQPSGRPLTITTATATAVVVGTAFSLSSSATATRLDVEHGRVRLERQVDAATVEVGAGEYAVADPGSALVVRKQGTLPGDAPLHVGGARHNQLIGPDGKRFVLKGAQVGLTLFYAQLGSPWEYRLLADRAVFERAFSGRLAQLAAMKANGINTVRIFVGGAVAHDPNNGYATPEQGYGGFAGYVQRLVTYADDARNQGFHVIFCYNGDDGWSQDTNWPAYRRLFSALVPALATNGNVLFELVHEPDIEDREWSRCSVRAIDLFRSLGYRGPLVVDLDHRCNWWYEPIVDEVSRHDQQLVFSLHFAKWVGWAHTEEMLRNGAHRPVILGQVTPNVGNDLGEPDAIAAVVAMRALVTQEIAIGAVAAEWNARDGQPPTPGTGMTDDDGALVPNSWGVGYRDGFSGRLPDWLPVATPP